MAKGWSAGNEIEYTGNVIHRYGGVFYEFIYLDGPKKGTTGVTIHGPEFFNA